MGCTLYWAPGTEWETDGTHDNKDFVVGWIMFWEDIQVRMPRTCEYHLVWQQDSADVIKLRVLS